MDKNEFCYNMGQELSTWKNRISAELKKIEGMDSGAKQKMLPIVEDFMMLESEMTSRIIEFRNECSEDYVPPEEGTEVKSDLGFSARDADTILGGGDFGG